jgi:hypothetical protein
MARPRHKMRCAAGADFCVDSGYLPLDSAGVDANGLIL